MTSRDETPNVEAANDRGARLPEFDRVAETLDRNSWRAWARVADLLAAEVGEVDEPARVSAEFVAMRLRRLADRVGEASESEPARLRRYGNLVFGRDVEDVHLPDPDDHE